MKKTKQRLHSLAATMIISSMIQSSFAGTTLDTVKQVGGMMTGLMNTYVQGQTQQSQAMMQQNAAIQAQRMMSTMKPQMGPAKFFPECPVLQRITNLPANACTTSSMNPADVTTMMAFETLAQLSSQEYERSSVGSIECINTQQKAFNSQLIDYQNNLKRLQDQLKKDAQVFRDNNKKSLADMLSNYNDLNGPGTSIDARTADYAKQFSPSCQAVLKGKKSGNGNAGLLGIMNETSADNKAAADFAQNRPVIEAQIIAQANKISASIQTDGIGNFNPDIMSENYKSIIAPILDKENKAYSLQTGKLAADIQAIDPAFNIGNMDGTFADSNATISNALANYKSSTMKKCMAGEDGYSLNSGLKINRDTINSLISQSSTDGGTASAGYRNAVVKILDNPDVNVTLPIKLQQIQALDKTYRNMVFNTNVGGQNTTESASQAFAKIAADCETFFSQRSSSGVMSPQEKGVRAQTAMQTLKNLHDALGAKVSAAITAKLLHCNGDKKLSGASCTEASMTPSTSSNFCLDSASSCSQEIQGCYAEVSAKVGLKTAQIKSLGAQYNASAKNMVANANVLFAQQKAAVTGLMAGIHQKFPGMNFVIGGQGESDPLFITDPAMERGTPDFGIDLVAGGNLDTYLNELPNKIGNLSKLIDEQMKKSDAEIKDYLNGSSPPGLIASLASQKDKWDTLAGKCKDMIKSSSEAIAKANEATTKQNQKNAEFCQKYNALSNSPNPNCAQVQNLTKTMGSVLNFQGNATSIAADAEAACAETNNEANPGGTVSDKNMDYHNYCKSGKTSNQNLLDKIFERDKIKLDKAKLEEIIGTDDFSSGAKNPDVESLNKQILGLKNADKAIIEAQAAVDKASVVDKPAKDTVKKSAEENPLKVTTDARTAVQTNQSKIDDLEKKKAEAETNPPSLCTLLLDKLNKESDVGKNAALLRIITDTATKSGTTTPEAKSRLSEVVGQMKLTSCGSISSATGQKDVFLNWLSAAPDAAAQGLGR